VADIAFNLVVAPKHFTVLGVKLSAVQIPDVISQVEQWIADGSHGKYVAVANVHMVITTTLRIFSQMPTS
jgi:UDP-N-acetyl-D-mannosaminuronic acid transferase (WecB/TagA/CpsF family)